MSFDPSIVVRGLARYVQDVELPGMLHARIVRSHLPHARVVGVDTSAVPAGAVVLTPEDVRDLAPYGCQIRDQNVLALDVARYAGDPIAAVAAATPAAACEAAELVVGELEERPAVLDLDAALAGELLVHERIAVSDNDAAYFGMRPEQGTNVCHRFRIVHGEAATALAAADVVVVGEFATPRAQQAPLEPHVSVARWEGGRLEVWTGTHTPFNVRSDLARVFGLDDADVRVVVPPVGGSFGAKTFVRGEAIAAALARKAGRPVRLVLGRGEDWLTNGRHPSRVRLRLGATADGTFVAKTVDVAIDTGAYADCGPGVAVKIGYSCVGPYRIPNVSVDSRCLYTNLPPAGAFRGYGATQAVWASEQLVDRLAERLGRDPLELRLQNVLRDGDTFCTGETMHDVQFGECLERVARSIGWHENRRGKGLALVLKGMQTPSRAQVAVEAQGDRFLLRCATPELGQGSRRALTLVASELLGATPERIAFPDPDTDAVPYDTRATSSRSTYMMSGALAAAVAELRRDGVHGAGEFHNAGGLDPDTGQGIASSHWHQGAAAAEVTVDAETGVVDVVRIASATYAGRVVHPQGAALQNEGSVVMGLGGALYEEVVLTEGQVTNANLSDYQVPSLADLPAIDSQLVERLGADPHGLGETGLPPVPAAIGNALGSLGIHVGELPLSAERVLTAIDRRDALAAESGEEATA